MNDSIDKIGARLKRAFKESPKTQKSAALQLGIAENSLSNYVNSKQIPSAAHAARIALLLDLDAHWLLTGEGEMTRGAEEAVPQGSARVKELEEEINDLRAQVKALENVIVKLKLNEAAHRAGGEEEEMGSTETATAK